MLLFSRSIIIMWCVSITHQTLTGFRISWDRPGGVSGRRETKLIRTWKETSGTQHGRLDMFIWLLTPIPTSWNTAHCDPYKLYRKSKNKTEAAAQKSLRHVDSWAPNQQTRQQRNWSIRGRRGHHSTSWSYWLQFRIMERFFFLSRWQSCWRSNIWVLYIVDFLSSISAFFFYCTLSNNKLMLAKRWGGVAVWGRNKTKYLKLSWRTVLE